MVGKDGMQRKKLGTKESKNNQYKQGAETVKKTSENKE